MTSLFSNSVTSFARARPRGAAGAEARHRRLPGLPARRRLLLRPGPERARGARRLPGRRATSTSPPSPPAPSTSSTAAGNPARSPRSPAAPAASRRARSPAARAAGRCAGSARSRSAPTAAISTRPRSAATPSTSSGGTNESNRTSARAASPASSCSGPAPAPPPRRCSPRAPASSGRSAAAKGKRRDVAGMNVILFLTDQERAIQHFPPNWLRQNLPGMRRLRRHGLSFERAFTNACMCSPARSTLMSGYFPAQHGVKYTLEEDMPASEYPQVELPADLTNLGDGDEGGRLQRRLQGQVALLEAGRRRNTPSPPTSKSTASPLEPARRRRQPERPRGRRRLRRQRRPLRRLGRRRRGRRGAPVPRLDRGQGAALLHGDLTGQPARRPLLPEQDLRRSRLRRLLAAGRASRRRRPTKKTSRPSPRSRKNSCKIFNLTGKPKNEAAEAQLPELLRQPDALLRQLPGQRPRQARRDRPARRHADRPHRRPRRDGPHPRRPAAEELQLLRGGDAGPARLLEPEAVPAAAETDALVSHVDFLPTLASLAAAPKSARADWQGVDYSKLVLHPKTRSRPRTTSSSPTTTSSPARTAGPTRNRRTTSSASAKGAGSWPSTTTSNAQTKPPQWEMYDLKTDPLEKTNLAYKGYERTPSAGEAVPAPQTQARPGREDPPAAAVAVMQRVAPVGPTPVPMRWPRSPSLGLKSEPPPLWSGLLAALAAIAAANAARLSAQVGRPGVSLGVVYLPAILLISIVWGLRLGLLASALPSAARLQLLPHPAAGPLHDRGRGELVALAAFVIAAIVSSTVAGLARARAVEAERAPRGGRPGPGRAGRSGPRARPDAGRGGRGGGAAPQRRAEDGAAALRLPRPANAADLDHRRRLRARLADPDRRPSAPS